MLNPKVWKDGSTYLKVQVEDLEDVDTEETYPDDDQLLMQVPLHPRIARVARLSQRHPRHLSPRSSARWWTCRTS